MGRTRVINFVNTIKETVPDVPLIHDVQNTMLYLTSQLNNMFNRSRFERLQVNFQIFLYLLDRIFGDETDSFSEKLFHDSERIISSAPNMISENYALQLWNSTPQIDEYIKYGVLGEPIKFRGSKKRAFDIHDLIRTIPPVISKIQEQMPPSI